MATKPAAADTDLHTGSVKRTREVLLRFVHPMNLCAGQAFKSLVISILCPLTSCLFSQWEGRGWGGGGFCPGQSAFALGRWGVVSWSIANHSVLLIHGMTLLWSSCNALYHNHLSWLIPGLIPSSCRWQVIPELGFSFDGLSSCAFVGRLLVLCRGESPWTCCSPRALISDFWGAFLRFLDYLIVFCLFVLVLGLGTRKWKNRQMLSCS